MEDNEEVLITAITYRRCVVVTDQSCSRVVEPYRLGVAADGRRVLLAYQVSAGNADGDGFGWKLVEVAELGDATILGDCAVIEGREAPPYLLDALSTAA